MRNLICLVGLFVASSVLAADPPGSIVIRPNGAATPPSAEAAAAPDKPGFIVIRPRRGPASDTPFRSALVGEKPAGPTVPAPDVPPTAPTPPPAAPAGPLPTAADKDGRLILETWDAAFLRGQKVGYFHVVVREYERDGKKFWYATKTQKMTVARFGQIVDQWAEDSTMESPEGTVLVTRMRQGIGKDQKLSLSGTVTGHTLAVKIEGAAGGSQEVPWPDGVIGIAKESTLFKDRKPKPGDAIDYLSYEGRLNRVVKFTATAKEFETIAIFEGQPPRKVLKLELAMEPIKLPGGGEFRMPTSFMWADAVTFEPLRMESDMPTMGGKLMVLRTTKDAALKPPGKVPDLFDVQSIRLDREIPGIHEKDGVVYRVKHTSDIPADKVFAVDDRQSVRMVEAGGKTFDLRVTPIRGPVKGVAAPADPGKEFMDESFFIDWTTDLVKRHANQAITGLPPTATAWDKARAIEDWVHRNMKSAEFSQAMATCANVAKTLSGDCTEYAMLATGMCRAVGVPSRTALGLVYAPSRDGKPYLAYHMWFEVYVEGQWLALDATLGRGSVGPGHLKITDASWHEERSFAPLLPVLGVLGAMPTVDVVSIVGR